MRRKRRSRAPMIWGILIAAIMILSTVGYMIGRGAERRYSYGDFNFVIRDDRWVTRIDNQEIPFYFHPSDLEGIEVPEGMKEDLRKPMIYLGFDPEAKGVDYMELARFRMGEILNLLPEVYVYQGVLKGTEDYALPVIGCENATQAVPAIILEERNETGISKEGNCFYVYGRKLDFLRLSDRILYVLLGVMG